LQFYDTQLLSVDTFIQDFHSLLNQPQGLHENHAGTIDYTVCLGFGINWKKF